ncbi:MAG TPA: aspartate carbamoyltransferase regulatory subunit [Nitrososphaerales archaeon]|nr:aspartate carbamoyltransferase regulatory subunit [Nitrososphaerales archaeon]
MEEPQENLMVRKIEDGTVVDHLPAWSSELALKVLRLDAVAKSKPEVSVATLQNVASKRLGKKDLIKVDSWRVGERDADILCLIFPTATINLVSRWKVSKYEPRVPDSIEGRVRCPELLCISNAEREPLQSKFKTLKGERLLQCVYCDTQLEFDRIPEHVKG